MLYAKFTTPNAGTEFDKKAVRNALILGNMYPVDRISMGGFHTTVYLCGFDGYPFNSVNFTFYENDKKIDIFKDKRYNPYLR